MPPLQEPDTNYLKQRLGNQTQPIKYSIWQIYLVSDKYLEHLLHK